MNDDVKRKEWRLSFPPILEPEDRTENQLDNQSFSHENGQNAPAVNNGNGLTGEAQPGVSPGEHGLSDGFDGGLADGFDGGLADGFDGGLADGFDGGLADGFDGGFDGGCDGGCDGGM